MIVSKPGKSVSATNPKNPKKSLDVLQFFVKNFHTSIRKAQEHQINLITVHKILKQNKFHPFKVHELNEDDFNRHVRLPNLT